MSRGLFFHLNAMARLPDSELVNQKNLESPFLVQIWCNFRGALPSLTVYCEDTMDAVILSVHTDN